MSFQSSVECYVKKWFRGWEIVITVYEKYVTPLFHPRSHTLPITFLVYCKTFFLQLVSFTGMWLRVMKQLSVVLTTVLSFNWLSLVHRGGFQCPLILPWVVGCKEWSRAAEGSPWVTARVACSGSRLGSVRMAVVVLRRRSDLRTTRKNEKKKETDQS